MQDTSLKKISVGQSSQRSTTITSSMIEDFAKISGDYNPVHLDDEYAASTRFGQRIAHGMLLPGLISAILANDLPGPGTIYLEQTISFKAPVFIGDTVIVSVECKEVLEKSRVSFKTTVAKSDGTIVMDGEALVITPLLK